MSRHTLLRRLHPLFHTLPREADGDIVAIPDIQLLLLLNLRLLLHTN